MAPSANPATTSLAQCARTTTRVSESPTAERPDRPAGPSRQCCRLRMPARPCAARGRRERRPRACPRRRCRGRGPALSCGPDESGRIEASSRAAATTPRPPPARAWLPARRSGSPRPREASQPAAARTRRTFSSAPQVRARAISSGAGLVSRAIARATATSVLVGRTVIGNLGPRRKGLVRIPGAVRIGSLGDVIGDGNAPRAPRFIVLSQSGFHAVLGTLACLWSGRRSLMPNGSRTQVFGSEPSALAEIECRAKSDGEQSTPSIFQGHPRGFSDGQGRV